MMVSWAEMPRSPGHAFYDRLQTELIKAGFDGFVEGLCAPLYAARRGRPSLPPGRYFRMLLVGYFEGIDSERGLEWRCADSLSLREFLRLGEREPVPDHSWLSRTRGRLPLELHDQVFTWVLGRLGEHGLIRGEHISISVASRQRNEISGGDDPRTFHEPGSDGVAQRELPVREVLFACVANRGESVTQIRLSVMQAPQNACRR